MKEEYELPRLLKRSATSTICFKKTFIYLINIDGEVTYTFTFAEYHVMGRNIVSALPKHTFQVGLKRKKKEREREPERVYKEALDTTQINLEKFMKNWNK